MAILPAAYSVDTVTHYSEPSGYYYGESGVHTWIDYCPLCGCHDCLSWNPKGANPGEWTCLECGADYDGTNGYDKYQGGSRGQLERYYEPEPTVTMNDSTTNTTTTTTTPIQTPLEKAQMTLLTYKIL